MFELLKSSAGSESVFAYQMHIQKIHYSSISEMLKSVPRPGEISRLCLPPKLIRGFLILVPMSEFGFVNNNKTGLQFEDHLTSLQGDIKETLLELRRFVKSLGNMVIEEVRPHRIVYAKTLNFRAFLDVQPKDDGLAIVVKCGRGKPESVFLISNGKELEAVKSQISQAFQDIK